MKDDPVIFFLIVLLLCVSVGVPLWHVATYLDERQVVERAATLSTGEGDG